MCLLWNFEISFLDMKDVFSNYFSGLTLKAWTVTQLQKRISILLGVFLRACSTDNFLSPILSPNLQSLEHVTTWVSRGEFRVKNVALCLHLCLAFFVAFHQKDRVFVIFISLFDELSNFSERLQTNWKPESVIRNCQWNCMLSRKVFLIKLWNQVLPGPHPLCNPNIYQ